MKQKKLNLESSLYLIESYLVLFGFTRYRGTMNTTRIRLEIIISH